MGSRADSLGETRKSPERMNKKNRNLSPDIPGARITFTGVLLCVVYLGLPVLVLGNLADWLVQRVLGWCVGFWCVF
jgi:hypothetical protein